MVMKIASRILLGFAALLTTWLVGAGAAWADDPVADLSECRTYLADYEAERVGDYEHLVTCLRRFGAGADARDVLCAEEVALGKQYEACLRDNHACGAVRPSAPREAEASGSYAIHSRRITVGAYCRDPAWEHAPYRLSDYETRLAAEEDKRLHLPIAIAIISPVQLVPSDYLRVTGVALNTGYLRAERIWGLDVGLVSKTDQFVGIQVQGLFAWSDSWVGICVAGLGCGGDGDRKGLQVAGLGGGTERDFDGVMIGAIQVVKGQFSGLQVGAYNNVFRGATALQIGAVNLNQTVIERFAETTVMDQGGGRQVMVVTRQGESASTSGTNFGAALGVVNVGDGVSGAQVGAINYAKSVRGVQLGLINVTSDLVGLQLGGINVATNNGLPFMVGGLLGF